MSDTFSHAFEADTMYDGPDFSLTAEAYNSIHEPNVWIHGGNTMDRKYAIVKFYGNETEYTYLTDFDLSPGDLVVVPANSYYQVVKVVETRGLTPGQRSKATKWVVQRLDITAHEQRLEKQRIAQEIRNKLREKKSQIEEMMIYQQLAKSDLEVQKLLGELAEVDETVVLLPAETKND